MYIVKTLSGMKRTSSIKEALQVNQGKYIAVIVNQQIQTIWSIKQAQTISWILDVLLGSVFGKNITSIILYGSAAKNTANSDSDIDLFVVFRGSIPPAWLPFTGQYSCCEATGIEVDLHAYQDDSWKDRNETYYRAIKKDGILVWTDIPI